MSRSHARARPDVTDHGPAEDGGAHLDGYSVIFTSFRDDWDLTPLLKGLPGEAFYTPPGHVPAAVAGTELVMFSPQDELAAMEAAMRELMMQKGNGN
jgi:hypothetical protein